MTTQLFLAPATPRNGAYQHFEKTVLNSVPNYLITEHETPPDETPRIWGLTDELESTWEHISEGDWVLFYVAENQYRYAAQVSTTAKHPELGNIIRTELLDTQEGRNDRDWTFLLFLDAPLTVSITGEDVADLFDYGNDFPVRFLRVTSERSKALAQEYGSVDGFIKQIRTS